MPLILSQDLPVYALLKAEDPALLAPEDACPEEDVIQLLLFNLMSDKVGTELQYLRCLGTSPYYVKVEFLRQISYRSPNQKEDYLQRFYLTEADILHRHFDAMLITGAPLEHITCQQTLYWEEFCRIIDWSKSHVGSVLAGCWGAFGALQWDYGVTKTNLDTKLSGIFDLQVFAPDEPLFRGCGEVLRVPLSRATDMDLEAVLRCPDLEILASAPNGSPVFLKSKDGKYIYNTGHPEYERERLAFEYARDSAMTKAWAVHIPQNYFPDDDTTQQPHDLWVEPGKQLLRNWLEYYVVTKKSEVH